MNQRRGHGPSRLARELKVDEVARHRHLDCGLYNICLELAAKRKWPSFTCRHCSLWPASAAPSPLQGRSAVILPMPLAR